MKALLTEKSPLILAQAGTALTGLSRARPLGDDRQHDEAALAVVEALTRLELAPVAVEHSEVVLGGHQSTERAVVDSSSTFSSIKLTTASAVKHFARLAIPKRVSSDANRTQQVETR